MNGTMSGNKLKICVIILLTLILVFGIVCCILAIRHNILEELTVEIGEELSAEDFKKWDVAISAHFETDLKTVNTAVPGDYPVQIAYYDRTYDCVLHLVDTKAPTVITKSITAFQVDTLEPADFIEEISDHTVTSAEFVAAPDMTMEGVQSIQLRVTDLGKNVTTVTTDLYLILDGEPPVINGVADLRYYIGTDIDFTAGVSAVDTWDNDPVLTVDDSAVDLTQPGTYTITYTAQDFCGNESMESAEITVIHDTEAPQIFGVNPISIYQGSTVSYRRGIAISDDYDASPLLSVDNSQVDLSTPGTYDVVYVVTDAAGNETRRATTITVKEQKEGYVDESVIFAMADELIATFITDEMSTKEQVEAIFRWVRSNCYYSDHTDKTDRNQAAYKMMHSRHGDCYAYFAICALFMDRLNIPNIAVTRNSRTWRHYWSMVSVDGGQTYYHFDATPALRIDIDVCLATDAVLRKCNTYVAGYYSMAEGVYPKTPKEPLE